MSDPKHSSIGLSKEYVKSEIIKCAENCEYFLEQYGFIRSESEGIIKFPLFDYQREVLKELEENRYLAILKSRQIGISTVIAGFIAWFILFHKQRHVFIMATKREKATISFDMVKTFVVECPDWLKLYSVTKNNMFKFELSNGSWVKASATSPDVGVGEAASLFFIDEAALIEKLREHWTGLFPTLATGGRCVMASTPRGVGNKFWEIVTEARNHDNEFKVLEYPWTRRFSKEWFEKEKVGRTAREIAQEYECKFLESGNTFLDSDSFDIIEKNITEPMIIEKDLWVWRRPEHGSRYLIGADVARGDGVDYSAFNVLDIETCEVVAEYRGKMKTNEFGHYLVDVAKKYNDAIIAPEANSFGDSVVQSIIEDQYENLYFSARGGFQGYTTIWESKSDRNARPGFNTTATSRPLMLQKLEEYIRTKKLTTHSKRLYDELTTFIWKNQRPEAMRGSCDDIIMSLAICIFIKDIIFKDINKKMTDINVLASGFISSRTSFDAIKNNKKTEEDTINQLAMMISRH
jgi:hypothetical protein